MLQHFVVISLPQESCFGTVENSEHTKEIYLLIKDMNDFHLERSIQMSLPILHLINLYYNANYLSKLSNVYTILQSNTI